MADYILFRDKSRFLLTDGKGGVCSSTIDGLIESLSRPEIFEGVYGRIAIPESFDDGRTPLTSVERETFLRCYFSN